MVYRFIGPLVAVLLLVCFVTSSPAEPLYGFEDEYGIVHLSAERQSPDYVCISNDTASEKLGIFEIKKRLRERGGAAKTRNTAWINPAISPSPCPVTTPRARRWRRSSASAAGIVAAWSGPCPTSWPLTSSARASRDGPGP